MMAFCDIVAIAVAGPKTALHCETADDGRRRRKVEPAPITARAASALPRSSLNTCFSAPRVLLCSIGACRNPIGILNDCAQFVAALLVVLTADHAVSGHTAGFQSHHCDSFNRDLIHDGKLQGYSRRRGIPGLAGCVNLPPRQHND